MLDFIRFTYATKYSSLLMNIVNNEILSEFRYILFKYTFANLLQFTEVYWLVAVWLKFIEFGRF